VRKISSPQRVASVSNLCNGRCQWAGSMGKGECCSGFGERVCQFISGKSSMTGDPLEAYNSTGGEGVGKIPNIPEELWLRNAGGVERKFKGGLGIG